MFDATKFKLGERAPKFIYNDYLREGIVEKVGDTYVTLLLDNDKDGKRFKAFRYMNMRPVDTPTIH